MDLPPAPRAHLVHDCVKSTRACPGPPDRAHRPRRARPATGGAGERSPSDRPIRAHWPAADTFWILEGLEQRVGPRAVAYAGSLVRDDGPVRWQLTHDSDQLVELDWTTLAPALSALGHPARLLILQLIARGEATTAADLADTPGSGRRVRSTITSVSSSVPAGCARPRRAGTRCRPSVWSRCWSSWPPAPPDPQVDCALRQDGPMDLLEIAMIGIAVIYGWPSSSSSGRSSSRSAISGPTRRPCWRTCSPSWTRTS